MTIKSPETCGSAVVCSDLLGCGRPYYQDAFVTLYNADAADLADKLPPVELVLTDPPYPNSVISPKAKNDNPQNTAKP